MMNGARTPTPFSLAAYRAAAGLASLVAEPILRSRARHGKEDLGRLGERLGHASTPRPEGPLVWMHAVSVGESLSLLPLIAALRAERPDVWLLVTSGTTASAKILAERLPAGAVHQYAPVDTPDSVRRFLGHWRPDVGLFVESELWPNLILAARDAGVRLGLISARMTMKSARRWSARPAAARTMMQSFTLLLAQDAATEQRLGALGGRVDGRLNLKRLAEPLPCDPAELARLRGQIGPRPLVVAVSTHAPEEAMVAAAMAGLASNPLVIIAPRNPERGAEVAKQLTSGQASRRSAGDPIEPDTAVYIADTMGELGLWLRLAPFAVMGGGFDPAVGGHNPMEAARLGVGVLSGPQVANHAEVYAEMVDAGAAELASDAADLGARIVALLADLGRQAEIAAASARYAAAQSGQMAAALDLIRPLLPLA
jgi:3-deoxy-D-manno-octulosonic-acid transferase